MPTQCQYAKRYRTHGYLVCARMEKPGVDYSLAQNAWTAFCLHQHHCRYTGLSENTADFRDCNIRIQKSSEEAEGVQNGQNGTHPKNTHRRTH